MLCHHLLYDAFSACFFRVDRAGIAKEHIELAAKLTFVNIVVLSLICAFLDCLRRKIMIDRPVKHIVRAAEKVMEGDFSARIGKYAALTKRWV